MALMFRGCWLQATSNLGAIFRKSDSTRATDFCLSSLHDAAFDDGLITLDEKLCLVLHERLRTYFPQNLLEQSFVPFEGKPIRMPEKVAEPDPDFLRSSSWKRFSTRRVERLLNDVESDFL